MKFTLGLMAILVIIGLGQAHQFPDFGKGPLHEDFQDILDLVPLQEISEVVVDYVFYDHEVQAVLEDLSNTTVIEDLLVDFEAMPEVTNLLNYLHKEGIDTILNSINKALNIKELVPSSSQVYYTKKRTGGLHGLFKDIKKHIDYDVFINIYVDKLKVSTVFVNFINQLKSDNFQQIVNKVCEHKSTKLVVNYLEARSVNLKIVRDIIYLVFGITTPSPPSKSLGEELTDLVNLIPMEEFITLFIQYINEDEKVQEAILFMFTTEFQDLLRALEATKEHQALVIYLEKAGIPVIEAIKSLHEAIGMEKYEPPKIESYVKSLIKTQKIGDGMKGMFKDLYDLLPLNKIHTLHKEKMRTSKVFVDFIHTITSMEMEKLVNDLIAHKACKEYITKCEEKGFDFQGSAKLINGMIGL